MHAQTELHLKVADVERPTNARYVAAVQRDRVGGDQLRVVSQTRLQLLQVQAVLGHHVRQSNHEVDAGQTACVQFGFRNHRLVDLPILQRSIGVRRFVKSTIIRGQAHVHRIAEKMSTLDGDAEVQSITCVVVQNQKDAGAFLVAAAARKRVQETERDRIS